MKQKRLFVTFAVGLCTFTAAQAQDNEFDLGSQRSEVQLVNPVPGKKMDHHGLVINPTPRYMKLTGEKTVDISGGIRTVVPKHDSERPYDDDLDFLPLLNVRSPHYKQGFPLRAAYGKMPSVNGVENVPGAYILQITPSGIDISGFDDTGVFYAIQTLRQIMENPSV